MTTSNCNSLTKRKQKCHGLHGEKSEKCMISTLEEKRCLAFAYCSKQAKDYYGTPIGEGSEKSLCASWEESYCFGNPRIMKVDSDTSNDKRDNIFKLHQNARYKVQNNRVKLRTCRDLSDALSKCLRNSASQV